MATLMETVSVSPATATLYAGQTQQFTASTAVIWTASAGTVNPSGLYTAPANVAAQHCLKCHKAGGDADRGISLGAECLGGAVVHSDAHKSEHPASPAPAAW
jgi:hypothetical protein